MVLLSHEGLFRTLMWGAIGWEGVGDLLEISPARAPDL